MHLLLTLLIPLAITISDEPHIDAPCCCAARIAEHESALTEAGKQFAAGERAAALESGRTALKLAEQLFEPNDPRRIRTQLVLASLLMQSNRLDEAGQLAQSANAAAEDALETARTQVASSLKFLGTLHLVRREFAQAEAVYARAVRLAEAAENRTETAKHLGNLGGALLHQGKLSAARAALERSMVIWDAQPSPHPVYTANALTNLALVALQENRPEQVVAHYDRALAIQEQAFGKDSPRLNKLLTNYAQLLRQLNYTDRAAALEARVQQP